MAKVKSFVDKLRKMSEFSADICPVCNSEIHRVKLVRSERSEATGSWRFNQNMVDVCKCNEKEVYPQ